MREKKRTLEFVVVWLSLVVSMLSPSRAQTPETRTLTPQEAADVLERDWLFQAMGESLLPRTGREINWARGLAHSDRAPDLSAELARLETLERHWAQLRETASRALPAAQAEPIPSWIWYPDGWH